MSTQFDYDLSALIQKAMHDRDVAVANGLRRFGAWVVQFFKGQDKAAKAAPTLGKAA